MNEPKLDRLQKVLARAGVASRRASEELIQSGRVTVNGQSATLGQQVGPGDDVRVDGQPIQAQAHTVTYMLHKPAGYVTSASDELGRETVLDAMPAVAGLHPVGRLDRDSEGLLILTTDGALTQRLTHPRYEHEKVYRVWCDPEPSERGLAELRRGVELEDGFARAEVQAAPSGALALLREGRKRQVRRMFAAIGCPVDRLLRYRVGGLWLGDLGPGEFAELNSQQLEWLLMPDLTGATPEQREQEQVTRRLWL
ncbi:pseudouridine synthase [Deinococcus radiophilus]|uniref:Pseudouridine synthase n=1 Tax=Deinococcus radiophilus TaxID=32062 RepID=A0A431VYR9_9DEIO|nr:pseudouridine synthase [Deinococcus radiophilus]RTR28358.1 rRNA pseudouridine synthase [Deinococcus radiophilus]